MATWPRVWRELLERGIREGKDWVRKLMQLHGIRAKGKRRFKVTTDSRHDLPISPNLLEQQFNVAAPDKVRVGDITYIATGEGWLFLAVVIDLFSRQVMGRSLRRDMTHSIVIDALRMAWFKRHPDKGGGLIFHSDRAASTPAASSGLCWPSTASPVQFNEPQGQLLGQRLQRDVVWLAQGRAPARAAL